MPANPIRVLWLKDHRPGHVNKARGFLASLEQVAPLEVTPCDVHWRFPPLRHLVGRLSRACLNLPSRLLFKNFNPGVAFDLIVSAGGHTQWPNVLMAHRTGAPNIYLGSTHHFPTDAFALLPTTDPPHENPPFLRLALTPSNVTPDAARACARRHFPELREPAWTLLLGGDGEGLKWTDADFSRLAALFQAAAEKAGKKMFISTSRRTRESVEKELIRQFTGRANFVAGAWYHASGGKTIPLLALLGPAERIFVTADSVSMTNEAVASGAATVAVYPATGKVNPRHERQFRLLETDGRIARAQLAEETDLSSLKPAGGWRLVTADLHRTFAEVSLQRLKLI